MITKQFPKSKVQHVRTSMVWSNELTLDVVNLTVDPSTHRESAAIFCKLADMSNKSSEIEHLKLRMFQRGLQVLLYRISSLLV